LHLKKLPTGNNGQKKAHLFQNPQKQGAEEDVQKPLRKHTEKKAKNAEAKGPKKRGPTRLLEGNFIREEEEERKFENK